MDFFEAQERARSRTKRLVFLFVLAVAGTILGGYAAALGITQYAGRSDRHNRSGNYYSPTSSAQDWWDPKLFAQVTLGTLAIVVGASLFKWATMRQGGAAIAESVGARAVDPHTTDLHERRLLNVVEEMAIASGIPVPAVYIMDDEPCLNAFAAGLTTADAAVTVTRGTLEKLTRDELQGVIGHEFSHILNGDMRLNVRLTALIFGILVIGLIGRGLLNSMRFTRVRSSNDKDKGGGVVLMMAIGAALLIIGYIGYFFGRLIQAAVSRQREFLADASAVQFTRNPGGITGALKKIGGYAIGSGLQTSHAEQLGHFFFAQGFTSMFGSAMATHPPLAERIRAIEPTWDGKDFNPPEIVDIAHESSAMAGFGGNPTSATPRAPARSMVSLPFKPVQVVADVGVLTESHFRRAQALLETIPTRLREATRDTATAQALVYGLLLSGDKTMRDGQRALVEKHAGPEAAATLAGFRPALSLLDPVVRLPLLQLSLPALRQLDAAALARFATTLDELVHADGIVSPFEFALHKMLLTQLQLAQAPAQRVQFDSFDSVRSEIAVVLSALARIGNQTGAAAATAFLAGAEQLPVIATQLAFLDAAASGFEQVDTALDKLAACSLVIKQRLLIAAGHVIAHDGTVTLEEGELYRAFAATLACPMPQLGLTT